MQKVFFLSYARHRPGPKLINRCKPGDVVHERILMLEQERVPAKSARGWKIAGQTRRVTKKEYKRLREEFDVGGFMAHKGAMECCQERECWKTKEPYQKKMAIYCGNTDA